MRNKKFRKVLYIRTAYQMTAISIILVLVISIVIVVTSGTPIRNDICGPVENIVITETDTHLVITWDSPIGPGCNANNITRLHIVRNDEPPEEFLLAASKEIEKRSCSRYIVTASSTDVNGNPVTNNTIIHFSGIAGTGQVKNLRENNFKLEWDKPENSDECNLTYQVMISTENAAPSLGVVPERYIDLKLIPCSNNVISVTSIVVENSRRGLEATIGVIGPTRRSAPKHVRTNPKTDGAEVTWDVREEAENHCRLIKIEFTYFLTPSDEGDSVAIEDKATVEFPVETSGVYRMVDLPSNRRHTYRARWILEGEDSFSDSSEDVTFKTDPLTPPTYITYITMEDGRLRIRWTQDYELDFVSSYQVTITRLGAMHFLPENCQPDGSGVYTHSDIEPDTKFLDFFEARPNFRYRIEVTTHFAGLNMYTSADKEIVSPMDAPGLLDEITAKHSYKYSVEYLVNTKITWKIPCDINGPIRRFEIKIVGNPAVNGMPEGCAVDFLTGNVPGGEQEQYSIGTETLVPFFDYTVHITTILDSVDQLSSDNRQQLTSLPAPHTPPS